MKNTIFTKIIIVLSINFAFALTASAQVKPATAELLKKAREAYKNYNDAEAAALYKNVLEIEPRNAEAVSGLGDVAYSAQKYDEALAHYSRAIKYDRKLADAYLWRGEVYLWQKNYKAALADFDQAIKFKSNNPKAFLGRGRVFFYQQKYAESLPDFARTIELDPQNAEAYSHRGGALFELKRREESLTNLNKAVELDSKSEYAYRIRSLIYENQKRYDEALTEIDKALAADPKSIFAYSRRAILLINKNHWSDVKATYREGLRMIPDSADLLNNFGYQMLQHGENPAEALAMIERAVKSDPKNPNFLDSLGWAYFKLEKLDEAETYLRRSIKLEAFPDNLEHLGDVQAKQKRAKAAQKNWRKALALAEDSEQQSRLKEKIGE